MADLVFATRGQAEMLAAQEGIRKKALETKQELEEAAKATGAWDAATMKLKSSAESALRSISSEQEKILDKIAKIQEAQEKGLIPPKEAEEGIQRLRQEWIDVDEATLKAKASTEKLKQETEKQEQANARLKTTAESALRSIQTEEEKILEQIQEIEQAMEQGLVPPAEAELGLARLRERLMSLGEGASAAGSNVLAELKKAFAPTQLIKVGLSFVGVKAGIDAIKAELKAMQDAVDERAAEHLKPKGDADKLADNLARAQKEAADATNSLLEAERKLGQVRNADASSESELKQRRRDQLQALDRELAEVREDMAREEQQRNKSLASAREERDRHLVRQREKRSRTGLGAYDQSPEEDVTLARLNQRIQELEAGGENVGLRRRLEALQRRQADVVFDNTAVNPAAANEAAQEVADQRRAVEAAKQRLREAAEAQRAFINSPTGLNLQRQLDLSTIAEEGFSDIAQGQRSKALSSEQIDALKKSLRAAGQGSTRQRIDAFINSLDGMTDEADMTASLRRFAADLADGDIVGGNLSNKFVPATAEESRLAEALNRMSDRMERRDADAARQREETNARLNLILQKEAGLLTE